MISGDNSRLLSPRRSISTALTSGSLQEWMVSAICFVLVSHGCYVESHVDIYEASPENFSFKIFSNQTTTTATTRRRKATATARSWLPRNMPVYFLRLALSHSTFRIPSLLSIAELYGFTITFLSEDRYRSILVVEVEKEEYIHRLLERGTLIQ